MTIHHDKLAYGKLASGMEEMSEDKLAEMLKQLSEEEDEIPEEKDAKAQPKLIKKFSFSNA